MIIESAEYDHRVRILQKVNQEQSRCIGTCPIAKTNSRYGTTVVVLRSSLFVGFFLCNDENSETSKFQLFFSNRNFISITMSTPALIPVTTAITETAEVIQATASTLSHGKTDSEAAPTTTAKALAAANAAMRDSDQHGVTAESKPENDEEYLPSQAGLFKNTPGLEPVVKLVDEAAEYVQTVATTLSHGKAEGEAAPTTNASALAASNEAFKEE